jgi:hypothetical protein
MDPASEAETTINTIAEGNLKFNEQTKQFIWVNKFSGSFMTVAEQTRQAVLLTCQPPNSGNKHLCIFYTLRNAFLPRAHLHIPFSSQRT